MTTMFTRNDKMPDPGAKTSEKAEPPAPLPVETKRPQASAQPMPYTGASQAVMASVISKALKITGQVESTEDIQLDGQIDGDVRGVSIKVGSNAKVKGSVYGEMVELAGTIEGKIEAKKVVLTRSAHMSGDVIHQDITIESGAYINGHCRPEFGKTENKTMPPVYKPVAVAREAAEKSGT